MARTRRSFIGLILAAAPVAPFIGRLAPRSVAPATAPGFHMVDGWILTEADLAALRRYGLRDKVASDRKTT